MSGQRSRREFLGISALGVVATMSPKESAGKVARMVGEGGKAPREGTAISVWVTSGKDRFAAAPQLSWGPAPAASRAGQIRLDPSEKYQAILGFGGAFTDAACYMFNQLSPSAREQLLHEMFHPSEMGLNVCRICVGSSDYSQQAYSFDEGDPDPELARFSIEHDREYILPVLRQARQVNPDLFLFASPWSPPGWMKSSGSMLGGSMRHYYLSAYAKYFLKFLQGYAAEGVPPDQSLAEIVVGFPPEMWKNCSWKAAAGRARLTRLAWCEVCLERRFRQGEGELEKAWLLVDWPRGEAEPCHYYLAHLHRPPRRARCLKLTRSRWHIEQYLQRSKDDLGLDHFEGRSWRGFHHHLVLFAVAYLFILTQYLRANKYFWCDVGTDPASDPALAGEGERLLHLLRNEI